MIQMLKRLTNGKILFVLFFIFLNLSCSLVIKDDQEERVSKLVELIIEKQKPLDPNAYANEEEMREQSKKNFDQKQRLWSQLLDEVQQNGFNYHMHSQWQQAINDMIQVRKNFKKKLQNTSIKKEGSKNFAVFIRYPQNPTVDEGTVEEHYEVGPNLSIQESMYKYHLGPHP